MAQARRALNERRADDAQGILINLIVSEPRNDEAWILLASTFDDQERRMECLQRGRKNNPYSESILGAIQELKTEFLNAAFGATSVSNEPNPALVDTLLETCETIAQSIIMTSEPGTARMLGLELVHLLERARHHDAIRARRWATSAGRAALVKYERALSQFIANLPQNDPQLTALREQRQHALDMFK